MKVKYWPEAKKNILLEFLFIHNFHSNFKFFLLLQRKMGKYYWCHVVIRNRYPFTTMCFIFSVFIWQKSSLYFFRKQKDHLVYASGHHHLHLEKTQTSDHGTVLFCAYWLCMAQVQKQWDPPICLQAVLDHWIHRNSIFLWYKAHFCKIWREISVLLRRTNRYTVGKPKNPLFGNNNSKNKIH